MFLVLVILIGNCVASNDLDNRIVGGKAISIEEAPWTVSYAGVCGGAILYSHWIITAAHCGQLSYIRAKSSILHYGEKFYIHQYYIHDYYNSRSSEYDVQLLRLERKIHFNKYAQPIRIGDESLIASGQWLTVVGWGRVSENGDISNYLRSVTVPIISTRSCQRMYHKHFHRTTMFCAGYTDGGKDGCSGDSGGPATVDNELVGLTSWGRGCGEAYSPGVYVRVPYMKYWIYDVINTARQKKKKGNKKPRTRVYIY